MSKYTEISGGTELRNDGKEGCGSPGFLPGGEEAADHANSQLEEIPGGMISSTGSLLNGAEAAAIVALAAVISDAVCQKVDARADLIAERVVALLAGARTPLPNCVPENGVADPPPFLLSVPAAAKLLGCSSKAVYHRVAAHQIPSSCIVRSGRRLQFHRDRLLAAMERRVGR